MDLCPYEKKTRGEFMADLYERSLRIEATSPSESAGTVPCGVCQRSTSYDLNATLDSQVCYYPELHKIDLAIVFVCLAQVNMCFYSCTSIVLTD